MGDGQSLGIGWQTEDVVCGQGNFKKRRLGFGYWRRAAVDTDRGRRGRIAVACAGP
jgi:hypothetical protein